MIVEIEDKSTGIVRAYDNVMNFWFDTNHFYLKFKEDDELVATTIFRRNSRLYRIRDAGYTPRKMNDEQNITEGPTEQDFISAMSEIMELYNGSIFNQDEVMKVLKTYFSKDA